MKAQHHVQNRIRSNDRVTFVDRAYQEQRLIFESQSGGNRGEISFTGNYGKNVPALMNFQIQNNTGVFSRTWFSDSKRAWKVTTFSGISTSSSNWAKTEFGSQEMKSKTSNRRIDLLKFVLVEMKGGMICDFRNWLYILQKRQVKKQSVKLLKTVT